MWRKKKTPSELSQLCVTLWQELWMVILGGATATVTAKPQFPALGHGSSLSLLLLLLVISNSAS